MMPTIASSLAASVAQSVILTGEPGVGKTAAIEGFAQWIIEGNFPGILVDSEIVELDMNSLVAGTEWRGQFEQKVANLLAYLRRNPRTIMFIDEIHTAVSAGGHVGQENPFVNALKPALASGEIRIIGATTNSEYDVMARRDPAFARRFARIDVPEPSRDESIVMIKPVCEQLSRETGVIVDNSAIEAAVELSIRHIPERRLPDKAIKLLRTCMSTMTVTSTGNMASKASPEQLLLLLEREISSLTKKDWPTAGGLVNQWFDARSSTGRRIVTADDVKRSLSAAIGTVNQSSNEAIHRVLGLKAAITQRVTGQNHAINAVVSALKRMLVTGSSTRPIGSFLFLGPTGVGKTELARTIASEQWGDGSLLQLDMSEYMTPENASRLIGSSPGYVGYEEGGRLVRAVASRPQCVVLFDEIEKAHPDVHNLLLQILEEGQLVDGTGKSCSFSGTIIILTSNIGADYISSIGAEQISNRYEDIAHEALIQVKKVIKPEIVNRLDEIIVFSPLTHEQLSTILDRMIEDENRRLQDNNHVSFCLTSDSRQVVLNKGYDPTMGARPLRRALQQTVINAVSDYILEALSCNRSLPTTLRVDYQKGSFIVLSGE